MCIRDRAKTEVLSSRSVHPHVTSQQRTPSAIGWDDAVVGSAKAPEPVKVAAPPVVIEGTDTEAKVLRLLARGPRTSAQIKDEVSRSREHTARLMKGLFERGLVVRNDRNKPYVYEITESGKTYVAS